MKEFPLDPLTVSEVLRLHVLGSGAEASPQCLKFRYQQRGGYHSNDDPGIELKKQNPAIVRSLGTGNVFDLSPGERLLPFVYPRFNIVLFFSGLFFSILFLMTMSTDWLSG